MVDRENEAEDPVEELADFTDAPDGALSGRVRRDINRRQFAGDALDFGLVAIFTMAWQHLLSLIEVLTPGAGKTKEPPDER